MELYPVEIDYTIGVGPRLDARKAREVTRRFSFEEDDASSETLRGNVVCAVPLGLFHVGGNLLCAEVEAELERRELEAADLLHLLVFAECYPQVPIPSAIVALGTRLQDQDGAWCSPFLFESEQKRDFAVMRLTEPSSRRDPNKKFCAYDRILVIPRNPERYAAA